MLRLRWLPWLMLLSGLIGGAACQPATRYPRRQPSQAVQPTPADNHFTRLGYQSWIATETRPDIPIVFVPTDAPARQKLPAFWNHFPPPMAGMRTIHLQSSPLGAVAALVLADQMEVIRLRVPLGLPDPTPFIPDCNPPTFAKWLLGKRLFFDPTWLTETGGIACATCHDPGHGFTERAPPQQLPRMNAPSLINCVYRPRQFWDGRAQFLEEVLQRHGTTEPIAPPSSSDSERAIYQHNWHGFVPRLQAQPAYVEQFERVFGIPQPTVDAAAKALATYMRTILSGESLYDQVRAGAGKIDGSQLEAKHYEPLLSIAVLQQLQRGDTDKSKVAAEIERGQRLFFSERTQCAACHTGWNFTDEDFHNIGIRESDYLQTRGREFGRFRVLPLGLKDTRMMGAFRTPSLRALPRTGPYFHDGKRDLLEDVVRYYNEEVDAQANAHLDARLLQGPHQPRRPRLTREEIDALALFLRTLDGTPLAPEITSPPR